ncbi:hypothetical protein Q3G72_026168 [Acer saccharum]|nr:hypothetical protein Q3G72_026168 [Acer saccharum]
MAIAGMVIDILSMNISFSCRGKSVNFKVDRPKQRQVDDCLVLEAPKLRKKRSRVFTLVQAFEGATNMEKGNHDCLKEQKAIELEEDVLVERTFKEIGKIRIRIHCMCLGNSAGQMSGRTKRAVKQVGQSSRKGQKRASKLPPCVKHNEFNARMEYFEWRDIVVERGLALEKLPDTHITRVVERRGWETFTSSPSMYYRRVVEEFYVALDRVDPKAVGRLRNGVTWNDLFLTQNVEFANELVIRPMEFWVAPDYRMKHTNLKLELGFWHVFISHFLIPRKHRTSVNFNAAMVLCCILNEQLVDIGYLVKREILELGSIRVDKQPLIFPSLITAFCKVAWVDFGVDPFDSGLASLKTDVLENMKQIADSSVETIGCFADVWDNFTNMREALSLPSYPRKKKRAAPFSPPSGPTIDPEAAELQAVMERSRKEHEERIMA